MLVENPWKKPSQWFARSAYSRRCLNPPSDWRRNGQILHPIPIELQTVVPEPDLYKLPSVRCLVYSYAGIDPTKMDAGGILGRPGTFTPTQFNMTDHIFEENPLCGRSIFLEVEDEKLNLYYFDVNPHSDASHIPAIRKNGLMRIFFCRDQNYTPSPFVQTIWPNLPPPNVEIFEHVTPGFASSRLIDVPEYTSQVNSTFIPNQFWQVCDQLRNGQEDQVISHILQKIRT